MRRLFYSIAAVAALLLAPAAIACEGLSVEAPWVRQPPPGAPVMAGFAQLLNQGKTAITVSTFDSADFGRVELHRSSMVDGMMRMERIAALSVAPGERVTLAPGGYHLMLMQPRQPIGERTRIQLHCADGTLSAEFPVRASAP